MNRSPWTLLLAAPASKFLMGLLGLGVLGFLTVHAVLNFPLLIGNAALYDANAHWLKSFGSIILAAEGGLLMLFLLHAVVGLFIVRGRDHLRPVQTLKRSSADLRGITTVLAPYTGLIIAVFLVVHVITAKFMALDVTDDGVIDLYAHMHVMFQSGWIVIAYEAVLAVLAVHLLFGVPSVWESLLLPEGAIRRLLVRVTTVMVSIIMIEFALIPIIHYLEVL